MVLVIKIVSFAPIAKGQQQTTQTVVNPSELPDFLPIGSEQVMLDWIVTNKQWHQKNSPLFAYTDFSIDYEKKGGQKNSRYYNFGNREFKSFRDYEDQIVEYGLKLLGLLLVEPELDPEVPLTFTSLHGYFDDDSGIGGLYLEKYLGYINEIKPENFRYPWSKIAYQSVVRIANLDKFDIKVEANETYTYSWPSKRVTPLSGFPLETTTAEYISLASWYGQGQYKARFKITAGGKTTEYTQSGTKIEPPNISITGSGVEVTFSHGTVTTIQESSDLVRWKTIRTIPWDFGTNSVSINYGSSGSSSKFFRAKSE